MLCARTGVQGILGSISELTLCRPCSQFGRKSSALQGLNETGECFSILDLHCFRKQTQLILTYTTNPRERSPSSGRASLPSDCGAATERAERPPSDHRAKFFLLTERLQSACRSKKFFFTHHGDGFISLRET